MNQRMRQWVAAAALITATAGGAAGDSVRDHGAAGDGVADDAAAIQRAVDAEGGPVVLPAGVYRLSETVTVDLDRPGFTSIVGGGVARVVMDGPGPAFRFVGTHDGTADPGSVDPRVWDRQRAPTIAGLEIVGDHPDADGVEARGTMMLTVDRLIIRKTRHAIHLVERNRNVIVSDSHLYENRGCGVFYDHVDLHQSNIVGCHISYNDGGGVVSIGGNVRNVHIGTSDLESNQSTDGPPTANVLIDCTGSTYGTAEVAITGCTIQHNNPSPGSANVRIIGASDPKEGLPVREGNVAIVGNVLSDVKVNLHLKGCRGVVVEGNTLWQGYEHNLLIEDSSDVVIGPNNLDRNPRYDYGNTAEANNAVALRNCTDTTITGLHVTNVWRNEAAVLVEGCDRLNLTDCTILDSDGVGLLLRETSRSRVSDCLIRDDRPGRDPSTPALRVDGGRGNMVVDNLLGGPAEVDEGAATVRGNVVDPGDETHQ